MAEMLAKARSERSTVYAGAILAFCAGLAVIFTFDGTGDDGDSITHFLFARYAPRHPALYFDHWAKPLFVLLASPFAQAGLNGMKFFNLLLAVSSLILTYTCAVALRYRFAWLAPLLLACFPLNMALTFSGLTEPLFAFITILGVYLYIMQRPVPAGIMISFLPFVRSEGLLIIGVVVLYFIAKKQYRMLPWLFCGTLIYSLAGYMVHKDVLWVFTRIPYATSGSVYGSGGLFHFVEQYFYVVGVPAYMLFWAGVICMGVDSAKKVLRAEEGILILGGFAVIFIAHSFFWYLGIFNSMGLKRVLVAVLPLAALICVYGVERLLPSGVAKTYRVAFLTIISGYVLIFPFTSNPAAIDAARDLELSAELRVAKKAGLHVRDHSRPLYYDHQYFSLLLDRDHFDPADRLALTAGNVAAMKKGDIAVWDNSPSRNSSELQPAQMERLGLTKVAQYESGDSNRPVTFIVYRK